MRVAKTKALICAFVFAYANCCFSHAQAHIPCAFFCAYGYPCMTNKTVTSNGRKYMKSTNR